jgi:hypothetical protein
VLALKMVQDGIVILPYEDKRGVENASGYICIQGYLLPEGGGAGRGGLVPPS